ncbi:MAG TPA: hypothetical protein VGK99_12425 [Acidobacteriota bacterium]|jgi:phenolic acid decarboxylase
MKDYPKHIKELIRQYADLAYEEELGRELEGLFNAFDDWRNQKISSIQLADLLYEFNKGPGKELYVRYHTQPVLDLLVAQAIVNGTLKRDQVPAELLEQLVTAIQFYETYDDDRKS